jgi:hypothetical protein
MPMQTKIDLRTCGLVLGVLLALYSVWFLAAEVFRPSLEPEFRFPAAIPNSRIEPIRSAARLAAALGIVRGDLWAERVLLDAAKILDERLSPDDALPQKQSEEIRVIAERAMADAPLSSPVWLVLATLTYNTGSQQLASEQLKMSYYTGPNDRAVLGRRLALVARFQTINDPDLRNAVRREIRTILLRAPDLRQSVISAYRYAQPEARKFIEATVSEVDPTFLPRVKF